VELHGHVLVVDDLVENLDVIEKILINTGYSVVRANSGAEALRVVHGQRFDAILMDIEMPGLDGWALCRVLKADVRTQAIPVVFMTARHGGDDQVVRALAMGGADYVNKPVHAEILTRRIGVLVRAHKAEAEQRRLAEDRADALAALGAAQAQALEARKLSGLSTMARGLAHEINNPLAAALSEVAYVASGRGTSEDRAEALAAAITSLERVKHIVERMRRLGDEVESSAPIALDGVVRAAIEPLVSLLEGRGITVDMSLERIPPFPSAGRLAPVIAELITNAARATSDGGHIAVKLRHEAGKALLTVRDQGTGMSPDAVRRAFDPFFTEKKDWRAIGLGLPMCHSVVSGLGGTIEIHSSQGQGTVVSIAVPIRPPPPSMVTPSISAIG
jgi:signal transduction histidine kinase